jgi:hypothetical protein
VEKKRNKNVQHAAALMIGLPMRVSSPRCRQDVAAHAYDDDDLKQRTVDASGVHIVISFFHTKQSSQQFVHN